MNDGVKRGAGTSARGLFGGLALAAALFFAPGAAQTADPCGALSSGAATCSGQTYANGIANWDQGEGFTLAVIKTETSGSLPCGLTEERCRLYEALPAALLAMNGLPSYGERMAAARDGLGGWARVDGAGGEWKAKQSDAAFDYRRYSAQAGVDFAAGEDARFGVSVRGLQGSAEMVVAEEAAPGGEVELSGFGAGLHGTAFLGGGFHVDVQAMVTRYYDIKLTAPVENQQGALEEKVLKDGATGRGYALGAEIGWRMAVGDRVFLTPGVGLAWSQASLNFKDGDDRVAVEDARSFLGRAGLRLESQPSGGPRLFGSVEAMHEFSDERTAKVSRATLKTTEAQKTGVRVGLGGQHGWADGRYLLRGSAGYAARGSGNGEFDGGFSIAFRF